MFRQDVLGCWGVKGPERTQVAQDGLLARPGWSLGPVRPPWLVSWTALETKTCLENQKNTEKLSENCKIDTRLPKFRKNMQNS